MKNKSHRSLHQAALGLLLTATLLYTLLLQKQVVLAQTDAGDSPQSPVYSPLMLPPGVAPGVVQYAEAVGVPYAEAERRMVLQGEMTGLQEQVIKNEPTYAGSWTQHTPTFGLVFAFADPHPQAILAPYLTDIPWADMVTAQQARYTMPELEANMDKVYAAVQASPAAMNLVFASGLDIMHGRVQLYSPDPAALRAVLETEGVLEAQGLTLDDVSITYQAAPMVPAVEEPAVIEAPDAPVSPLPVPWATNLCRPRR